MARDVEFNVTASDKTGTALASAEAKFKASQERIRRESDKTGNSMGDSFKRGVSKSGPGILDSLQGIFLKGGASGGDLLAVGLAAAAPVIGATLSAAIIGGAGVGGVIGGVVLAARDPRVKAAGSQLGETLMSSLTQDASVFVGPILRNLDKVEARFGAMNTRISRIFANSSGFLDPLVDGALDAVDGILRGFDALVAKGAPVMKALGNAASIVGDAIGDALTTVSGDSEDAASALTVLAKAIGTTIEAAGWLVRGLTEVYGVISYIPGKVSAASEAFGRFVGVGEQAHKSAAGTAVSIGAAAMSATNLGNAATSAAPPIRDLDKEMSDAAGAARSLYGATTDVAGAMATAKKTIGDNGKALSLNTEKGRQNRAALLDVANALTRQHDAAVTANGENAKSAAISSKNRAAFLALAEKAGYSAQKARELATSLGLIPTRRETLITASTAKAEANAKRVRSMLDQLHNRTISVDVIVNTSRLTAVENRLSRLHGEGFAAGNGFAFNDPGSGVSRTGGPTPVNVTADVVSRLYLDGSLVYANTARQVDARSKRDAWRQKVGTR